MAIRTTGFAFLNGVPGWHPQLCLQWGVAIDTDFNLVAVVQHRIAIGVGFVAVITGDIFIVMGATLPHHPLIALMATQALAVTGVDMGWVTGAKTDQGWVFSGLGAVFHAIAMALNAGVIAAAHRGTVGGLPDTVQALVDGVVMAAGTALFFGRAGLLR
jgi:hypothetical protein